MSEKRNWTGLAGIIVGILQLLVGIAGLCVFCIAIGLYPLVDDFGDGPSYTANGDGYGIVRIRSGLLPRAFIVTDERTGKRFVISARGGVVEISSESREVRPGANVGKSQ